MKYYLKSKYIWIKSQSIRHKWEKIELLKRTMSVSLILFTKSVIEFSIFKSLFQTVQAAYHFQLDLYII